MTRAGTARQTQQQQPPPAAVGPSNAALDPTTGSEFFDLQREAGNQVVADWFKARVNNSAFQRIGTPAVPVIQRKPANNGSAEPRAETEQRTETGAVARSLIVEDDAQSVEAGQMRKSEFLTELRTATTSAAEEVLAGTMWSAMGCPYIDRWFSHYEGQSAQHVERAVQRYAPEARGARNARDYIPAVTNRLRRGIEQWRETGEVPADMPEEFASGGMPGMTAGALIGGLVGGAVSAIGGAVSSAASSIGRALFKEREGGAEEANDPAAIKGQLGSGRSLDGASKSRMEAAFGANFSNVRIHTDAKAHRLSNSLNARAFTIGSDIAFGSGEYNPGTPVGDALIAHELAHVTQQCGAQPAAPLQKNQTNSSALEEDADDSAVGVVVSLWGRSKSALAHVGQATMPSLKSGLQLQKCSSNTPAVRSPEEIQREFDTVYQQILSGLPEGATRDELALDLQDIRAAYEFELQTAGSDASKQAELQQRFHNQLETMRQTAPQLVELARTYGISFTGRSSFVRERSEIHQYHRAWTREELQIMDALLSRVPRTYLSNIRKIQRTPEELNPSVGPGDSTPTPDAAASWQQNSQTLHVFDLFFRRPEHERLGIILHEVGHSTVTSPPAEETGGFTSLPSEEWMRLSDWKRATSSTLAASVGINDAQARQLISELTANKRTQVGRPRPVERNNRMVIYDKYQPGRPDAAPTQFFHYQKDKPFVSDYARTHPAEDFAESFSRYLHDPQLMLVHTPARRLMGEEKWRFLETHHPHRLQPEQRR
ncbi:MAG TPA: DUF4157 domain-containing protein [Pyrinomonadaceae bacterium]|nr:DUF4157 domain-containing protein [Pyrinomonadaceae bacterium]